MTTISDKINDHFSPTTVFPGYVRGYIRQLMTREEVPTATAAVALRTAVAVAEELGLPRVVTVYFYRPCAAGHPDAMDRLFAPIPNGLCTVSSLDEIWVRADLSLTQTQRTVAHECRHLWQTQAGWGGYSSNAEKARREGDARRFENEWMARKS